MVVVSLRGFQLRVRALDALPTTKYSCCCSTDYIGSSLASRGMERIGKLLLCLQFHMLLSLLPGKILTRTFGRWRL